MLKAQNIQLSEFGEKMSIILDQIAQMKGGILLATNLNNKISEIIQQLTTDSLSAGILGYKVFSEEKAMHLLSTISNDLMLIMRNNLLELVIQYVIAWNEGSTSCVARRANFIATVMDDLRKLNLRGKAVDRIIRLILNYEF
jgi:hypothetical protein